MKTAVMQLSGVPVLTVREAVTSAECDEFRASFKEALGTGRTIIVDLAEVPFLDSAALELLLDLFGEQAERGGRVKLAGLSPNCQEILRITDLRGRLDIYESVEDAARRLV